MTMSADTQAHDAVLDLVFDAWVASVKDPAYNLNLIPETIEEAVATNWKPFDAETAALIRKHDPRLAEFSDEAILRMLDELLNG
jgi:hypothetical protein